MSQANTIPDDFNALLSHLNAWAEKQELKSRATEGLAECFKNEGGTICGWTYDKIRSEFFHQSLYFKNTSLNYPYVITALRLSVEDGREIGSYKLVTLLNGEVDDDYLVIDISQEEFATLAHAPPNP